MRKNKIITTFASSMDADSKKNGLLALSPMVVFLGIYLISSIALHDFYAVPVSAAFILASAYAMIISKGTLQHRIEVFSQGAGDRNVLLMIWIFVLAGAFASTAKEMGAIDAAVNATLSVIPSRFAFAGLFLAANIVSFSIGTSVGTIVALMPIAAGIARQTGLDTAVMAAVVVGGAFFGDNLSFISDTTIAATQALGCRMRDKFKSNLGIVLPAFIVVIVIYLLKGTGAGTDFQTGPVSWIRLIPYLAVIVLALLGCNVIIVLSIGLFANAVIGISCGGFGWGGFLSAIGSGIAGMSELIIVTLLAGGMLALMREAGALDFIMSSLSGKMKGKRGAELSIAATVSLANLCTANNTIAIITTGELARNISERFNLSPRRTASILDTFSCMVQGLIPYGAQLLMASSLSGVGAIDIIPNLYYPMALGLSALLAILVRR